MCDCRPYSNGIHARNALHYYVLFNAGMVVQPRDFISEEFFVRTCKTKLHFTVSAMDAGTTVIVLEAQGQQFAEGEYTGCSAEFAPMDKMELSQGLIRVTETESGSLLVENLTQEDIPRVRIFYKFYMHEIGVYLGGITYTAKMDDLKAGSSQIITPSHYLAGYSKIVMIKTYDE